MPGFIVAGIQEYGITVVVQEPGGTLRLTPFAVSEINASYHYSFGTIRSLLKAEMPASSSGGAVSSSAPESAAENTPEEQPESTTSSSSRLESESSGASSSEPAEPSFGEQDTDEPQAGEQSNPAVMILVIVAVATAAVIGVLIWKRRRS